LCYNYHMEVQPNDIVQETQQQLDEKKLRAERKKYKRKLSARLYRFFSFMTFFIYYVNFTVRVISRTVNFYNSKNFASAAQWWEFVLTFANWDETVRSIFDWYTITLLVFLMLYFIVFLITFIRFSPKNKKTFKYFKKGFLMARRLIKLINLGLTLTVLINSAKLATFGDKFMFVLSLCSLVFTVIQIFTTITTWVISRKINKSYTSVKAYVGKVSNVVSNYIATSRTRPAEVRDGNQKLTIGDKLGKIKSRFVTTVEALTASNEAIENGARQLEDNSVSVAQESEKFENDYVEQPVADEIAAQEIAAEKEKPAPAAKVKKKPIKLKDKIDKNKEKAKENLKKAEENIKELKDTISSKISANKKKKSVNTVAKSAPAPKAETAAAVKSESAIENATEENSGENESIT